MLPKTFRVLIAFAWTKATTSNGWVATAQKNDLFFVNQVRSYNGLALIGSNNAEFDKIRIDWNYMNLAGNQANLNK